MSEYMRILNMIEDGQISPEKGAEMLQNLDQQTSPAKQGPVSDHILKQLDLGEIDAEEAIRILNESTHTIRSGTIGTDASQSSHSPSPISDEELSKWKRWWMIPMYAGAGIVTLSALWINSAYQNSGYGFWFFCAWIPLLIGALFMILSWRSQTGPWIHVRIRGPKERLAISLPAPLKLTGWAIKSFGNYIPHMEKTYVDEILTALDQTTKEGAPLYIHVDEEGSGEKVEVFIG